MKRREVITLLGGAAVAWPLAAYAQLPAKVARIGFLGLTSAASHAPRLEAFSTGLRELGYVEGKNIIIEYRWAEQNYDRLPALAAELVRLNVDIILTHAVPGTLAATRATTTIPIVITAVADMVVLGVVSSLSRPGGNVTGLSIFTPELAAKRLELVKDVLPSLTKAAVISNANNPIGGRMALRDHGRLGQGRQDILDQFEALGGQWGKMLGPVTFPPGRDRLDTTPRNQSATAVITIGIVVVARVAASVPGTACVRIISTLSRTIRPPEQAADHNFVRPNGTR